MLQRRTIHYVTLSRISVAKSYLVVEQARMGHETLLYAREKEVVASINDANLKENTTFLKVSYAGEGGEGGGMGLFEEGGGKSERNDRSHFCPCTTAGQLSSLICL